MPYTPPKSWPSLNTVQSHHTSGVLVAMLTGELTWDKATSDQASSWQQQQETVCWRRGGAGQDVSVPASPGWQRQRGRAARNVPRVHPARPAGRHVGVNQHKARWVLGKDSTGFGWYWINWRCWVQRSWLAAVMSSPALSKNPTQSRHLSGLLSASRRLWPAMKSSNKCAFRPDHWPSSFCTMLRIIALNFSCIVNSTYQTQ